MSLEPEEKVAGRLFRDRSQADLDDFRATTVPDFDVPFFIAIYRHLCPARDFASMALELREVYVTSPRIVVLSTERGIDRAEFYDEWAWSDEFDTWIVPAGRFGFVYRTGRCAACNQRGTSIAGHFVDAWNRPPLVPGHR